MTFRTRILINILPGITLFAIALSADAINPVPSNGFGKLQVFVSIAAVLALFVGVIRLRRKHSSVTAVASKRLSVKKKLLFATLCTTLFGIVLFCGACVYKSYGLYVRLSSGQSKGWKGTVHTYDPVLGYKSMANSAGAETFLAGPDVPTRYDGVGFRVPVGALDDGSHHKPVLLFLGCSFTYGSACLAENTFPQRVGQATGGTTLNAGKCGYGLCQMVILARELVPKYKPDYVVVQYSPWLGNRAMSPYMPSRYCKIPGPYYARDDNGELSIQEPVFATCLWDLPIEDYKGNSNKGFLSFLVRVDAPRYVHDFWHMMSYKTKRTLGILPTPTKNREEVLSRAYGDILTVCQDNNARLVVLVLGSSAKRVEIPEYLQGLDVQLVDAHQELINRLKTDGEFDRIYKHWRGDPPRMVDGHPNSLAHTIISEEVLKVIQTGNGSTVVRERSCSVDQ